VLTGGRSVTLILRNGRGDVTDLVPLDPADLHVQEQVTAEFPTKTYRSKSRVYQASEVIDLTFMLKHNQIDIRGPVMTNKDIIGWQLRQRVMDRKHSNRVAFRLRCYKDHSRAVQRLRERRKT
jgi:hypothetical protein